MCHAWVKFFIGLWLILSGIISILTSPINMLIIGFMTGICCFRSSHLWQAFSTGILGFWLFISGLSYLFADINFVAPFNFIVIGLLTSILGVFSIIYHSRDLTTKTA